MGEQVISPEHKIGDIMARIPQASDIFKDYKIDFCCGGGRPLAAAIAEQGLDAERLLQELNKVYEQSLKLQQKQIDWREAPLTDLSEYIIHKHHTFLSQTLPALSEYTLTLLRVHGNNHRELARVHKIFHALKTELDQHLITEEQVLFPLIKEYEQTASKEALAKAVKTIKQLEEEHEGAGKLLKELRHITDEYQIPADACTTYAKTYQLLNELEGDIFQHIHLENNILHPRLLQ